jgi:hypothetical protein
LPQQRQQQLRSQEPELSASPSHDAAAATSEQPEGPQQPAAGAAAAAAAGADPADDTAKKYGDQHKLAKEKVKRFLKRGDPLTDAVKADLQPVEGHANVMAGVLAKVVSIVALPIKGAPFQCQLSGFDETSDEHTKLVEEAVMKLGKYLMTLNTMEEVSWVCSAESAESWVAPGGYNIPTGLVCYNPWVARMRFSAAGYRLIDQPRAATNGRLHTMQRTAGWGWTCLLVLPP